MTAMGVVPLGAAAAGGPDDRAMAPAAAPAIVCAGHAEFGADGRRTRCDLAADAEFANMRLPAGSTVTFGADGQPRMVRFARTGAAYGQPLPAGTVLHFQGGRLRHFWLPVDTDIQGHRVRAQDDGAGVRLHPNGRLLAIWLVNDEVIDGVPCTSSGNVLRMGLGVMRLGTMRMAWFRSDGRLQQCLLANDATIDGHRLRRGSVVSLDPTGHVDLNAEKLSRW